MQKKYSSTPLNVLPSTFEEETTKKENKKKSKVTKKQVKELVTHKRNKKKPTEKEIAQNDGFMTPKLFKPEDSKFPLPKDVKVEPKKVEKVEEVKPQTKQNSNKKNKKFKHKNNQSKMKPVQAIAKAPVINPLKKVKIMMLGGVSEIGKNITVIECDDDIIVIDCGLAFPDEDMLGIDLVIPDITYLEQNKEKIKAILITHGHEDHIGAIPYVLRTINPPIFGTKLTLGILENKLAENQQLDKAKLNVVKAGDTLKLGCFSAEFIRVNHSIADACAIAITTPAGVIFHTGDFKLDVSPIDGEMMDLTRIGEYGKAGVLLLMAESTNAERPGFTPSEKTVGASLDYIFSHNTDKRIVIATFSSNVHRVQQIINCSVKSGRKIAVTGRSLLNVLGAALNLGYMDVPAGAFIDICEINRYKPEQITIITTGSQGEPMSALYRMAFSDHAQVSLTSNDLVILSSHAIPGNEKLIGKILNELYRRGINVYHDDAEVHVSGHACQEDLKLMMALLKPKYFMPIHGEYRHLVAHKELAEYMGIPSANIVVTDIGQVVELTCDSIKKNGTVPSGKVLIDGYGVGDVGNIVLRDRKLLSQDGLIVVVASVDIENGLLISGPDIVSRGFVYVRESEELMEEIRTIARDGINKLLDKGVTEWTQLKNVVKDDITKYLVQKTKRKPMILPIIMNV